MPNRCESCRFFAGHYRSFEESSCVRLELPEDITAAREICNKEGDGIFVYFEPKTPTAGATFGQTAMAMVASSGCFKESR